MSDTKLPDVGYGKPHEDNDEELPELEDDNDDDEELEKTPQDVIDLLGFDPKEFENGNDGAGI